MDYSHLIRGTREFFQGHPGKPRDNSGAIAPPLMNYPESKSGVKRNHEPLYHHSLQSHSQVIKSNCPAQSGSHGTLLRRYPEPCSEDFISQQQMQTSLQVNNSYATKVEVKDYTWIQSPRAYAAHRPRLQYEGQKVWEPKNYPESADVWSNTRLIHNQPTSAVPATIPGMVTPVAYQGHPQQIPTKSNEYIVPATHDLHRGFAPEAADCSSYAGNFTRLPFVQNSVPKNSYQSHSPVASQDNANLTQFHETSRQPTCGKFYNQSSQQTSHSFNPADSMPAPVSCDCLFNRPCPLHRHRHPKQQDIPIIKRQNSEWDLKTQNNSIDNNFARPENEYTSSGYHDERLDVFRNPEMMRHHQNPPQQNYQELPTMTSNINAFAPPRANVEADVSARLSTNFRPQPQTYLTELARVKIENNLGSELGGVSVIQQPQNNPAIAFGSAVATKKNEERMSVISYTRKPTPSNITLSKNAQDQSLPATAMVSWPKKEPATHLFDSLQSIVVADSIPQLNRVSLANGYSNNMCPEKQSYRVMKPPKLKMQSFAKPVNHSALPHNLLIDSPLKSDPIVSDEKWEEWQSSFNTDWNAFVKDLAGSGNIKRIHRVTQPIPKKIKRREQAKPMKGSLDSKLPNVTDFSSDEDIPLSLRRRTKEDNCNKLLWF